MWTAPYADDYFVSHEDDYIDDENEDDMSNPIAAKPVLLKGASN